MNVFGRKVLQAQAIGCFLVACSYPRTQAVLVVSDDQTVQTRATEVVFSIETRFGTREVVVDVSAAIRANGSAFPIRVPISSQRGRDDVGYVARVTARRTDIGAGSLATIAAIATNKLRSTFIQGRVLEVPLWLGSQCACDPDNERCVPGLRNEPTCVDVELIPDARAGTDAELDATIDGRTHVDAGRTLEDVATAVGGRLVRMGPALRGETDAASRPSLVLDAQGRVLLFTESGVFFAGEIGVGPMSARRWENENW